MGIAAFDPITLQPNVNDHIGSTHNGQGNSDAQHNSIVSDTDFLDATSPAWFMNQSHLYPIDGIKTQSIDSSRIGDATVVA